MQLVRTAKIIILVDQLIIAADIQLQLIQLGYEVIGIHQCASDTLLTISKTRPDFVLIDVGLGGSGTGIEVAQEILAQIAIPIVFLSYGLNSLLFQKMIKIKPYALIPKPFLQIDLDRGVQTAMQRIAWEKQYCETVRRPKPATRKSI